MFNQWIWGILQIAHRPIFSHTLDVWMPTSTMAHMDSGSAQIWVHFYTSGTWLFYLFGDFSVRSSWVKPEPFARFWWLGGFTLSALATRNVLFGYAFLDPPERNPDFWHEIYFILWGYLPSTEITSMSIWTNIFFHAQAEWCANKGLLSSFPHVNLLESRGLDPTEDSFPPSIWALHWTYLPCNTDQYNQVFLLSHFSVGSILGMGLPVLPWILFSGLAVRNKHRASVRAKGAARDLGGHFGTRKRR